MSLMFALIADIEKNLTVSYYRKKTSRVDVYLDRWEVQLCTNLNQE